MPRRQFWCSFCPISFKSIWKLNKHLYIHMQQLPVACNLCPLKFYDYSQLGNHIRHAHSDDIITRFVEFSKRNFIKNIQLMETNTNSDSDWLNTSREQTGITSCEEVQCLEKDYRRVKEEYECKDESRVKRECECMDESEISFTKEINGNEASNNENRVRKPNQNVIDKDCINDGMRKDVNTFVTARPIPYMDNRSVADTTDDCRLDVNTFVTARPIPYMDNRSVADTTDDCRLDVNTFVTARPIPYMDNRSVAESTDDCRLDVNTFVTARPIPYMDNRSVAEPTDDCRLDVNSERCKVSFRLLGNLESKTNGKHHLNANFVNEISLASNNLENKTKRKHYMNDNLVEKVPLMSNNLQIRTKRKHKMKANLEDKVPPILNKYTELQKMKSVHVKIEPLKYPQRPVFNDTSLGETCQHSKTSKQIEEIAQLTVQDEISSTGYTEWTEAIQKLKSSFRKKRKRDKGAKFISDPESFSNWLTVNLPIDGIICGCGRHLKTVKAFLTHLHRKSRTALKCLKIFKKGIGHNP
ncbi:uncharacterized protein LOC134693013 [Mytilus trossulus]|uniref:uncharacterized protein LOC134693013 n=1 Tax=Mytilus trossulus TaxID=6551 RepID=UPI003003FC53